VVWADETADAGFAVRSAPVAGGKSRTHGTFAPASSEHRIVPAVSASATRVALEVSGWAIGQPRSYSYAHTVQTFQGPIDGRLQPLGPPCATNSTSLPLRSVDVLGDTVARTGTACTGAAARGAALTDFASVPAASTALPDDAERMRLAGGLVAFLRGDEPFVVRDRASGADVYEVPERYLGFSWPGNSVSVELQADGKLAYLLWGRGGQAVGWSSPQEPAVHVVALPPSAHVAVRWAAADQLLVLRVGRGRAGRAGTGVLELRDLSGRRLRTLARGVLTRPVRELFDADGRRAAYVTRDCRGVALRVVALDAPTAAAPAVTGCPLRLTTPLRYARTRLRGRVLRARIDCAGFQTRCVAYAAVATARIAGRTRVIARNITGAGVDQTAERGLELQLNATGRRLLRRDRRPRVRIAVDIGDSPTGGGVLTPGGEQRRTGTFRVG